MAPKPALGGDPATITINTATPTRSWPSHTFTRPPAPPQGEVQSSGSDTTYISTFLIVVLVLLLVIVLVLGRAIMLRRAFRRRMLDALTQGIVVDPDAFEEAPKEPLAKPCMTEVCLDTGKITAGVDEWRDMKPLSAVVFDHHWREPEVLMLTPQVMLSYMRLGSGYFVWDAIVSGYRKIRASIATGRNPTGQSSSSLTANRPPHNPSQTDQPDETQPGSTVDPLSSTPVLGVTWIITMPNPNRPTYAPTASSLSTREELPEIMLAVKEVDWIHTMTTTTRRGMDREEARLTLQRNMGSMYTPDQTNPWMLPGLT